MLLSAAVAVAQTSGPTAKLAWDYDDMDRIDGFRLYCDGAEVWTGTDKIVGMLDAGIGAGPHSCYVTAYNAVDESQPSNTVSFRLVTDAPAAPALRLEP